MLKKIVIASLICTLVLACEEQRVTSETAVDQPTAHPPQINELIDRHTSRFIALQPALASSLNLSREVAGDFARRLPDYSPEGMSELQQTMHGAASELAGIDPIGLDEKVRLHLEVNRAIDAYYAGKLDFTAGYIDTWGGHLPYIVNQISGPLIDIPTVLKDQHQINSGADAEDYIERLKNITHMVRQVQQKVGFDAENGVILPKNLFPNTLGYLDDFVQVKPDEHFLVTSFIEKLAELDSLTEQQRDQFAVQATALVQDQIYPAYREMSSVMQELLSKAPDADGIWAQPDGSDFYQHEIEYLGDTTLSADEIHQTGLDEVQRITQEIDAILRANNRSEGSVGERLAEIGEDEQFLFADSDEGRNRLLNLLREQIETVMDKAPSLFASLPKEKVLVKRVPAVVEAGAAGGYYSEPALDGSRPGAYYINLRDMKAVPGFSLKTLTYHEAVPGHHFQIALAMEQKGIGIMRQIAPFNAFVEGWALYAERLAYEMGMYADDPFGDIGRLQAELYRAARLVVDTGLHHKRWTRQEAIEYFYSTTGTARTDATAEIERYMAWPGQALGYKLGMLKILGLRDLARGELEEKFDIKQFHDLVLLPGARPLAILEADVKRWIAAKKG